MSDVMVPVHRGPRALTWLLGALGEPTRRQAFDTVRLARRPLTRAEVAEALDIGARLAAFHLDKLVNDGLLTAHYARPPDRPGGPGAGRPAKWYTVAPQGFDITVPPRRHDIAARILLLAITRASGPVRADMLEEARACGRTLASKQAGQELESLLTTLGYEPSQIADGSIEMENCPFHELVEEAQDTVCSMNLALLQGVTDMIGSGHAAVSRPRNNHCCVTLSPGPLKAS